MLGRALMSFSALANMFGPFIADFNETHVMNPRWPPHAKFHNGQTMSMGLCLGLVCLYYTFRSARLPAQTTAQAASFAKETQKSDLFTAALIGSLYWITGLSAILYPGTLAVDPEFGTGFPQFWLFSGLATVVWVGWWVEGVLIERRG